MTTAIAAELRIGRQGAVVLLAATALLGGALVLGSASWRHGMLLLIGAALGLSLYHAAFGFTSAYRNAILHRDVSLMDIGILLGALVGAGMAQRFAPSLRIPLRSLLAAVLGGLVMGYGARMAFGCNIGAFFSGVASFSLHGWVWIVFALIGTWLGVRLRPLFGLKN